MNLQELQWERTDTSKHPLILCSFLKHLQWSLEHIPDGVALGLTKSLAFLCHLPADAAFGITMIYIAREFSQPLSPMPALGSCQQEYFFSPLKKKEPLFSFISTRNKSLLK